MDVEGSELPILHGATSFINMNPKPIWMLEVNISEHQPNGIPINPNLTSTSHFFWSRGYEVWTADKRCRIIHPDEIEAIVKSGVDTLRTHNFLFIEQGKKSDYLN